MGVDDAGRPMRLSPDPRLDELRAAASALVLGKDNAVAAAAVPAWLAPIVGVDLDGLAGLIAGDVAAMASAPGAVRVRLHEVVEARR
jgi:hypothetical protein